MKKDHPVGKTKGNQDISKKPHIRQVLKLKPVFIVRSEMENRNDPHLMD